MYVFISFGILSQGPRTLSTLKILLNIHITSLVKGLLKSFANFLFNLSYYIVRIIHLYVLDSNPLTDMCFAKIFTQTHLFIFLNSIFQRV